MYNSMGVFSGCSRVIGSFLVSSSQDTFYSWVCRSSNNIFGCVGLRNKKYCILNRQYSKEEYENLLPKIIAHMDVMPYVSSAGERYAFGDFYPPDLSRHGYSETVANEYFPLDQERASSEGFIWRERAENNYIPTLRSEDLPNSIHDVSDNILNEVVACGHDGKCGHHCTKAFRLIAAELAIYRRLDLPLPQVCPNCRHYGRAGQRNPLRLWSRKCDCKKLNHFHSETPCSNEFESSFPVSGPEIVYCEQCYQAEVV